MTSAWPAEWSEHRESLVVWPGRPAVWDPFLAQARQEFRATMLAISDREPVRLIVPPGLVNPVAESATRFSITATELPTDDAWARDMAPLFVDDSSQGEVAVGFTFNSWGMKFAPFDQDAAFGQRLASVLGVPHRASSVVLEGGAIDVDGYGTALLVETSVFGEARNPDARRADVEELLFQLLGVTCAIWLPHGLRDDSDTDGHVDNVARFVAPGRVACQVSGRDREDGDRLAMNRSILATARDARGRQLEVVDVPWLPYSTLAARRPASYCNFYIVNGAVLLPVTGAVSDDRAMTLFAEVVGRDPVPVTANYLAYGGGGVHCIVMPRFQSTKDRHDEGTG